MPDIFRVFVKGNDILRQPPHRPNHKPMQGEVDQSGSNQRNQQRKPENAPGELNKRLVKRSFVYNHLDNHIRILWRMADDPQDTVFGVQQRLEGIADQSRPFHIREFHRLRDGRRHIAGQNKSRRSPPHADRRCIDMVQQLIAQAFADHAVGGRIQRKDRQMGRPQLLFQPGNSIAGDGGAEDEYFRQHDEENRQHQQSRR